MADTDYISTTDIQAALTRQNASWSAGQTSVSELPPDEKRRRLGYVPGPDEPSLVEREALARAVAAAVSEAGAAGAPAAWDWRNVNGRNFVTRVRDQGSCGSCVAFGTVASIEASVRVHLDRPDFAIDLSEAQLFYCVARSQGRTCGGPSGGWWVDPALNAFTGDGIADEACYPYVPGDQNCSNLCGDWRTRARRIESWKAMVTAESMKLWISSTGPLVACFTVYDDFFAYTNGVYRHVTGAVAGGHCVCVVGYDDVEGCWICKNSWSPGWGQQGYFRIAYGECGIDAKMWGVRVGGATPTTAVPLYRYWSGEGADHFYTTDWSELENGRYGWNFERVECYLLSAHVPGTVPLYRYWAAEGADHFYTTDRNELGSGRYGWVFERIAGHVYPSALPGTVPLYRYWNGDAVDHFYTTNWTELESGRDGWTFEWIQCYVCPTPNLPHIAGSSTEEIMPATFRRRRGATDDRPSTFSIRSAPPSQAVPHSFQVSVGRQRRTGGG
jgi:C1A family cysteine protease